MPRQQISSSSSGSSYNTIGSNGSAHTYNTDVTAYSDHGLTGKESTGSLKKAQSTSHDRSPVIVDVSPRASVDTYASTLADEIEENELNEADPMPRERRHIYRPEAIPATSHEFAALYPSRRRLMIQHDETTLDGNMNLRVDTEIMTHGRHQKKITLFHLRMKNLAEREFSLRRYGRESGREVASSKTKYVKSTSSTPSSSRSGSQKSRTSFSRGLSAKPRLYREDSGYESDEDDEGDRQFQETLRVMTAPKEEIVSRPTNAIHLEFSNYAQVVLERKKLPGIRQYAFEYWGDMYMWQREKHIDEGELVYSFDLVNISNDQKLAIIMPDALSAQEEAWENRQGGWIPASSMRLLRSDISDDLADVIMATGLISVADDAVRKAFGRGERRR